MTDQRRAGMPGDDAGRPTEPDDTPPRPAKPNEGTPAGRYDDDGTLAQQTPGLDPESIRREAGPDWAPGTTGDVEAEAVEGEGEEPAPPPASDRP